MSKETRKRLLLISLVSVGMLVGVAFAALMRKPLQSQELVSTLTGYETNHGLVTANIIVSNASSYTWNVTVREGGGMRLLPPGRSGTWMVQLPSPRPPHLQIVGTAGGGKLSDQVRRMLRGSDVYIYILELP